MGMNSLFINMVNLFVSSKGVDMKNFVTLMMCLFSVMSFAQKDYSELVTDYKGRYSKLFGLCMYFKNLPVI